MAYAAHVTPLFGYLYMSLRTIYHFLQSHIALDCDHTKYLFVNHPPHSQVAHMLSRFSLRGVFPSLVARSVSTVRPPRAGAKSQNRYWQSLGAGALAVGAASLCVPSVVFAEKPRRLEEDPLIRSVKGEKVYKEKRVLDRETRKEEILVLSGNCKYSEFDHS